MKIPIAVKLSEELLEKLPYVRVCTGCRVLGQDMLLWKKKRCPLCSSLTRVLEYEKVKKVNGKFPKSVKRFPRLLNPADAQQKAVADLIVTRTRDFDCPGIIQAIVKGPVVTEYEFVPDRFTRVRRLKSLNEDLALTLSVDNVTIRRIAGKNSIGIAIPNEERLTVTYKDCMRNLLKHRHDMELPINFGLMSDGSEYVEDLASYPHLLIGGQTGAGKSVFIRNIISSLVEVRSPKQLRLVLIDPKTVELYPFKDLPHLMEPPESDVWGALKILDRIDQEMRRRTRNLHIQKVQNIKELNDRIKSEAAALYATANEAKDPAVKNQFLDLANRKTDELWPYIVVVIDEMADLVIAEKKLFTEKLAAITQMARAAGICVIAATQRPSVDVLTGRIKTNFGARAAFRVPQPVDSKTILGSKGVGAETLLGKGDLFLSSPNRSGLQRIHVPLCTPADRDNVVSVSLQLGYQNGVPADTPEHKELFAPPAPVLVNGNGKSKQAVS